MQTALKWPKLGLLAAKETCIFLRKDNSNLEYSFETGMVYPPEGLFYIEMDPAPPGKSGLKAGIV